MSVVSSLKDIIYQQSPVFVQNFLVSTYGKSLFKQRYSGIYNTVLSDIKKSDTMSAQALDEQQVQRMKRILLHAQKNVPYYQALFKEHHIQPELFTSLRDLQKIPPLEKETLRNNIALLHSSRVQDTTYFHQKTSGSTGKPLEIDVDDLTYKRVMALLVHHEEQHGVKFGAPRATFAGRMIQPIDNMAPPFSRFNKAENQRFFSSYHINEKTISQYVKELNEFKPEEIIGYPSAIYLLAFWLEQKQLELNFQLKLVVTNSETLLDWQREKIEHVLKAPVKDYYGTAEYVMFANQCEHNNYHISPELGAIEIVDSNNNQIMDEEGDILCTTFSNYTMPLIRYRVGDRAVKNSQSCTCKLPSDTLSIIIGRVDDYIITRDDRKIGRMDHIYKGLSGIRESQLIQVNREHCLVKVVVSDKNSKIDEKSLLVNFKQRVGDGIDLKIEYVDDIPKNKNGKFKAVVNQIS